jgi:hypothetical protein
LWHTSKDRNKLKLCQAHLIVLPEQAEQHSGRVGDQEREDGVDEEESASGSTFGRVQGDVYKGSHSAAEAQSREDELEAALPVRTSGVGPGPEKEADDRVKKFAYVASEIMSGYWTVSPVNAGKRL